MSTQPAMRILLVEDNPVNQLMAQGTLAFLGHEVTVAADGQQAVDSAGAGEFDLILMDLMLPVMDGYEATQAILANYRAKGQKPTPIVALTAHLDEAEMARCREHGLSKWLSKPISPEEFQGLLDALAQESATEQEPGLPEDSRGNFDAGSAAGSPALIDAAELWRRVKDPKALSKIVDLFCHTYPQRLVEAERSLSQAGALEAKRALHTLRGNFLNFGASTAAQLAHDLTVAVEEYRWEQVRHGLPDLAASCAAVEKALRTTLATHPQPAEQADTTGAPGEGFQVVVADGDPASLALCATYLRAGGYGVLEAPNGEEVLRLLAESEVDVVVMGVMMPGLDGFETCRRIKANPSTCMIPVLLLTALDERSSRLEGMEAGADDFLIKPLDPAEAALRVRNAARGKALYDRLETSFEELKQLEQLRDGLTHMLVHDLRGPLTIIKGYATIFSSDLSTGLTAQQKAFAEKMLVQSNRLVEMVSAILDVNRLESDQLALNLSEVDLAQLLRAETEAMMGLPEYHLELDLQEAVVCSCDRDLISRVVGNLMANAFKYAPKGSAVTLALSSEQGFATVAVVDKGPGVPVGSREKIFEKFGQVEGETHRRPYSSGLGLTFCQLVVQKHGGQIGVDDGPGGVGSRFWFTLPLETGR